MSLTDRIARWLLEYINTSGATGFVLGLSGGVDSSVALALAVQAASADRVLGVLMPCHSQQEDAVLAQLVADAFSVSTLTVDLGATCDALMAALPPTSHPLAASNVKPRLRMMTLYYLAQARNYLVLGSGNRTEIAVGYYTKHGDGGVDLLPLGDLNKTQVWELARDLGVPRQIVERPPSAGLWPGQTDEGEMGITYADLDRVLAAIAVNETAGIDVEKVEKVRGMVARSEHKRVPVPVFRLGEVGTDG